MRRVRSVPPGKNLSSEKIRNTTVETLPHDDFVVLPEHEYVPTDVNPDLLLAFDSLSQVLRSTVEHRRDKPNARLFPYYSTLDLRRDRIDFMLAWGTATALPHPRAEKVAEYFSPLQLKVAAMRKRALVREMLDGWGVLGRLSEGTDDTMQVAIVSRSEDGGQIARTSEYHTYSETDAVEIASNVLLAQPLRFHRAVKHIPWNGYIGNVIYQDDESGVLQEPGWNRAIH